MGFDWGRMIGGVASGGSGLVSGLLSYKSASDANKINQSLTNEQRIWEQDMANSAHQREVEDLRKAGLNPILSAGGSGAVTPIVAPARVESTWKDTNKASEAISNGLASALTAATIKTEKAKKDMTEASTAKIQAEADVAKADADFYNSGFGRFVNGAQKVMNIFGGGGILGYALGMYLKRLELENKPIQGPKMNVPVTRILKN